VPPYQETRRYIEKISAIYNRVDGEITEKQIDNSYAAARALSRGEAVIYRYQRADGFVYSDMPPGSGQYEKISLKEAS
jgi:hypothetical protein